MEEPHPRKAIWQRRAKLQMHIPFLGIYPKGMFILVNVTLEHGIRLEKNIKKIPEVGKF